MRKFVCALVVTAVAFSVASAETFFGRVTRLTDKSVTVTKFKKGDKKGEEVKLDLAAGVKFIEGGMFDKEDMKFTGGEAIKAAKAQDLVKEAEKGRFAVLTTNDANKVTEIRLLKGFGKGKGKKKPDTE
jgi:hypothetical protein